MFRGFHYVTSQVGAIEGEARSALYRLLGNHSSKGDAMEALGKAGAAIPIGTEVKLYKRYRASRGYEPGAAFKTGQDAEIVTLRLEKHSAWYDPATGKPAPAKWKVVQRVSRKHSSQDFKGISMKKPLPKRDTEAYKSYLITINSLNGSISISKGGAHIGYANSVADAKRIIDELTAGGSYGRVDVTRNFKRTRLISPKACAPGSFRVKRLPRGKLLTVCCPRGKWQPRKQRCKVGTRAQSIARPRR